MARLLTFWELDRMLRLPVGKSDWLARRGKLPHIRLPNGEVRFRECDVQKIMADAEVAGEADVQGCKP